MLLLLKENIFFFYFTNTAQRFALRLDVGEHAIDYEEVAKQEHLSGLINIALLVF